MRKKMAFGLAIVLLLGLLSGCAGTPVVYYDECTCATDDATTATDEPKEDETDYVPVEGAVKTGLAVVAKIGGSENAVKADYDVTLVAVTVDDEGRITSCIIDSIGTQVNFDATGTITSDINAEVMTKNELGDSYGMKAYGGSKYEWYEQAAALADYAVGKTVEELKNGAIDETGKAPAGTDLATTASIYLGGYVSAIETAVANAVHAGAQAGDVLHLASVNGVGSSTSATAEKAGTAQLDSTVTALTEKDGKITSCVIDSVQAKVSFDAAGTITTELTDAPVATKNQLGENYGMKAWGGAKYEWNEQAAFFAEYVVGKTAAEVGSIAVTESRPADADLAATVTIKISDFQELIQKAMK